MSGEILLQLITRGALVVIAGLTVFDFSATASGFA